MRWLRAHWDRVAAWSAIVIGALVLLAGWNGASNTPFPAEQLPFILSGGVGGALLVALGAALLISADLRDEWHVLDRIERALTTATADTATDAAATPAPNRTPDAPAPPAVDGENDLATAPPVASAPSNGTARHRRRPVVADAEK